MTTASAIDTRPRRTAGFTLVEVLIATAIVAIIAVTASSMVVTAVKREKEMELRVALRQIRQAIDDWKRASDAGHIARAPGDSGYPRSLVALAAGTVDLRDPAGRRIHFLRRVPRDPFATRDDLPPEQTWGLRSSTSEPDRPEPGDDVYDVHSLSPGVGLNRVPYRNW
jgi:general secretion pathway protein G